MMFPKLLLFKISPYLQGKIVISVRVPPHRLIKNYKNAI